MSYVVLKIWDGRRIIYPSSYFTTTPFENYTRTGTEISAGIDFHVDWRVPVEAVRARLRALLDSSELWDGRDRSVQVLDIAEDRATLRVAVSARNAGDLWDLQCLVREDLIKFIAEEHPQAMNIMRIEQTPPQRLEAQADTTADQKPEITPKRHQKSWDMSSAPQVDKDTVRSWRHTEPPVEIGVFPAVSRKQPETQVHTGPDSSPVPLTQPSDDGSMYTGSVAAIERGADMAGPGEDAYRSRTQRNTEVETDEPDDEVMDEEERPEDLPEDTHRDDEGRR